MIKRCKLVPIDPIQRLFTLVSTLLYPKRAYSSLKRNAYNSLFRNEFPVIVTVVNYEWSQDQEIFLHCQMEASQSGSFPGPFVTEERRYLIS